MKRNKRRIIAAVAVIAALAAGGAAFTDSNTISDTSVAGYGNVEVSGATITTIHNVLSGNGQNIKQVVLTFDADQTGNTIKAGFGTSAGVAPTNLPISCTLENSSTTVADCGDGTTDLAPTAAQVEFAVAVSQ